jgi:hypothetical protein
LPTVLLAFTLLQKVRFLRVGFVLLGPAMIRGHCT